MSHTEESRQYELTAEHLLNQMAETFSLDHVEGKQTIPGRNSGTEWEIDAKGVKLGDEGFVIIECRRTRSRQKQEQMGGLAYRILDTGAAGALVVAPLPLQEGAAKVAEAENIQYVTLTADSNIGNYVVRFMNKVFVGVTEHIGPAADIATIVVRRASPPTSE